jgi:RNA polymerase sigma-70 factor, ECF subfamily
MQPNEDLAQLVAAAKTGDDAAFDALVAAYTPRLLLFLRRCASASLGADADELDLLQETLVQVHRLLPRYEHRDAASWYRWLVTVARHVVQNRVAYLDANGRRRTGRLESTHEGEPSCQRSTAGSTPSRHAVRGERVERLRLALEQLPPDLRQIVEGKVVDGMSLAEIAERRGLAKSSVFDRLHAGMAQLERSLRARGIDSEP